MSKQLIGIEIGVHSLQIAIIHQDKGQISAGSFIERQFADTEELTELLQTLLAGEFRLGDRLASCLPARSAYVRRLEFPFQDEKKIAAAIPFELSAQLPIAVDNCATAMQKVRPTETGAVVTAAAVPKETLESLLTLTEKAGVPLHRVDLAPFGYAASFGEQIGEGFLLCITEQETTVSLIQDGRLADYRLIPGDGGQFSKHYQQTLYREMRVMMHAAGNPDLSLSLMGPAVTPELERALRDAGYQVEMLSLVLAGELVESRFLPAAALALSAKTERSDNSFNFRRGDYALKGEWANLKKKLALLATLLATVLIILAGSMTVKYIDKASRAERLQDEMVEVYRSLFPEATTIVDVPLQLQRAIQDLQQKQVLMTGRRASALAILREVSHLPEVAAVEIDELAMTPEDLKMTGRTSSFEAVNQMAQVLEESPFFSSVQVNDAKMSLDGSRIDFRLSLTYGSQENPQ